MKIAMITTSLFSQGAEYVSAAMARGMFAAGHQVDVLVSAVHTDMERTCTDRKPFYLTEGIRIIRMRGRRARQCILSLRNYMRDERPDVMLCNASPFMPAMVLANLLLPASRRIKIVNVEHSGGVGLGGHGNGIRLKKRLCRAFQNRLLGKCDAVFTVSEGNRLAINRVTGYPLEKIYTVYNPAIDEQTDYKLTLRPEHPWLVNHELPVFVSAGALTGWKNFALLIRAFARVRKESKCRLVIFGEGTKREELETLVRSLGLQDDVSMPGYTDQLPAEIKAADAFVVSSDVESFSIVLVEAMATGVAIISTDAPYGPPEILDGGKYGRLVKRGDENELAGAMREVLEGHGVVAPKTRVDQFRVEPIVARYEESLRKAIGHG